MHSYFYIHTSNTNLIFVFFNDTPTTEISPLPLHDALPISRSRAGHAGAAASLSSPPTRRHARRSARAAPRSAGRGRRRRARRTCLRVGGELSDAAAPDRKSTRLNSSHSQISYAVFCLKKKK